MKELTHSLTSYHSYLFLLTTTGGSLGDFNSSNICSINTTTSYNYFTGNITGCATNPITQITEFYSACKAPPCGLYNDPLEVTATSNECAEACNRATLNPCYACAFAGGKCAFLSPLPIEPSQCTPV